MENIKIDKGIPIPPKRNNTARYPWAGLKIGESFFASPPEKHGAWWRCGMSSNASIWGRKLARKFTVRQEGEGVRVWRTE